MASAPVRAGACVRRGSPETTAAVGSESVSAMVGSAILTLTDEDAAHLELERNCDLRMTLFGLWRDAPRDAQAARVDALWMRSR